MLWGLIMRGEEMNELAGEVRMRCTTAGTMGQENEANILINILII